MKVFCKLIVLFLMVLARHAQITHVNFATSLKHLKKEVSNEVRCLIAVAGSNAALTIYYSSNVFTPLLLYQPTPYFSSLTRECPSGLGHYN